VEPAADWPPQIGDSGTTPISDQSASGPPSPPAGAVPTAAAADGDEAESDGELRKSITKELADRYRRQREQAQDRKNREPPSQEEILQMQEQVAAKALSIAKEQLKLGRQKRASLMFANIVNEVPHTKAAQEAKKLLEGLPDDPESP
jgi:hypothetical protein